MKKTTTAFLALMPSLAFAVSIPLTDFDQSKLEGVLRQLPSSLVKSEDKGEFLRKHHALFKAGLDVKCSADYYGTAPVPSFKRCEVGLDETQVKKRGDEWAVEIKEKEFAHELHQALAFGQEVKQVYSTERIYGQAFGGEYRQLFRYHLACTQTTCKITFAQK